MRMRKLPTLKEVAMDQQHPACRVVFRSRAGSIKLFHPEIVPFLSILYARALEQRRVQCHPQAELTSAWGKKKKK